MTRSHSSTFSAMRDRKARAKYLVTVKVNGSERDVYVTAANAAEAVAFVRSTLTGTEARWASVFA